MSEMVDRVARTIAMASGMYPAEIVLLDYTSGECGPRFMKYRGLARLILLAIREPTDADAGYADDNAGSFTGMRGHDVEECKDIWRAMIDRALEE